MQISDCINGLLLMVSRAGQQVHCLLCNDDSCITIIINNFSSRLI